MNNLDILKEIYKDFNIHGFDSYISLNEDKTKLYWYENYRQDKYVLILELNSGL